jgi:hypothetical protein
VSEGLDSFLRELEERALRLLEDEPSGNGHKKGAA